MLEDQIGVVEGVSRWKHFLNVGSRTAIEFQQAWNEVSSEANQAWDILGKEHTGALAKPVEDAGGISTDGTTRRAIVAQREGLRHELISHLLKTYPNREARPVMVFENLEDKSAGRWLLTCPGPSTGLSGKVFAEALSAHLCLPSPAVVMGGWVGKPVCPGGESINQFGDQIMNCRELPGDSWRHRHDSVKQQIMAECVLAKLPVDCEVYGLFADLIPSSSDDSELQWGRARQGLIPDFRLLFPSPEGPRATLAELKLISAGRTWYPRGQSGKGTDRRAARLTSEYERKLKKYDAKFHGTSLASHEAAGPLVSRLRSFGKLEGLVAGPWGDLSKDFHVFIKTLGDVCVAAQGRARGWECDNGELGKVVGEIRRSMSCAVVRAQHLCLLARLSYLGPGARAAAQRQNLTQLIEGRRRRESQAYWLSHVHGRGLGHEGEVFVP